MECKRRSKNRPTFSQRPYFPRITTSHKVKDSSILWWMLAMARLYLATVQTGYIHPDEFHQSVQVMARDVLDIDAKKPWEFHTENPIRSVTFSALVSLPYFFIKYTTPFFTDFLGMNLLTPNILLTAPRIFVTFLSFIADFCVYRIARLCYLRPWSCVDVFASSYIMLVYATRTFSNTIELILMALLLWRVCESMVDSTKIFRKENILQDLYETAEGLKERVRFVRIKSKLPPYNYVDSAIISVVVTYGTFVRPTFVVFSFIPVAYWLQRGVVTKEVDFSYFNKRCLSLLPGIFVTLLTCVMVDSFYYGSITIEEFLYWNVTGRSFIVTPINFVLYNTKETNLAGHGLHPYYTHLAVNLPMLHGVLGIVGMWSVSKYVASLVTNQMTKKPKVYSMASMLLSTFIIPVLVLSAIPHQEPRFLLPTLLPLVILHSDDVLLLSGRNIKIRKHVLFLMWHVWNILMVVFFGFLHQGGVTKAMTSVHGHIIEQPPHMNTHIVFSKMYTPPTFMLTRRINVIAKTEEGRRYRIAKSVFTYDAGSLKSVEDLHKMTSHIYEQALNTSNKSANVIVCLPASLSEELFEKKPNNVTLNRLERVRGHLTLENPPDLSLDDVAFTKKCGQLCQFLRRLDQFSIDIIEIDFGHNRNIPDNITLKEAPENIVELDEVSENVDEFDLMLEDLTVLEVEQENLSVREMPPNVFAAVEEMPKISTVEEELLDDFDELYEVPENFEVEALEDVATVKKMPENIILEETQANVAASVRKVTENNVVLEQALENTEVFEEDPENMEVLQAAQENIQAQQDGGSIHKGSTEEPHTVQGDVSGGILSDSKGKKSPNDEL